MTARTFIGVLPRLPEELIEVFEAAGPKEKPGA
jgi:hypothetical protein